MFPFLQSIASHVIKVHASSGAATGDTRTSKEDNWLKRCEPLLDVALSNNGWMLNHLNCIFAGIYNTVELNATPVYQTLQPQYCRRVMLKLDRYDFNLLIINGKLDSSKISFQLNECDTRNISILMK